MTAPSPPSHCTYISGAIWTLSGHAYLAARAQEKSNLTLFGSANVLRVHTESSNGGAVLSPPPPWRDLLSFRFVVPAILPALALYLAAARPDVM